MKKICLLLLLLCIAIALPKAVTALVAITPGAQSVTYEPGTSYELSFLIQGSPEQEFTLSAGGELAAFLELPSDSVTMNLNGVATIKVKFTVPEIAAPGKHTAEVVISEKPGERLFGTPGNVHAYASVRAPIEVFVPCPDKCTDISFGASDVDLGQIAFFTVNIINTGSKDILAADGQVEIYDSQGNVVASIPLTTTQNIAPGASASLNSEWQAQGDLGLYAANATVNFDEYSKNLGDTFKVGDLFIDISSISPTLFYIGDYTPVFVSLVSKWGQTINNVYALVEIKDINDNTITSVETPTLPSIGAWDSKTLSAYLTASGLSVGNYTEKITLHYEDKTGEKEFPITVENKPVTPPEEKKFTLDTNLLAIGLLIIALVALVYAYARKKNRKY
jgi:hypothetical protein